MRALVWLVSVTMPACEPVSEIALWPRSLMAIAHSAHDMRSPVESSMSISRGSGVVETSSAIWISSSVVLPRAESTATTRWPLSRAATIRRAARLRRSASATDVPPNFITTVPGTRGRLETALEAAAPGEGTAERDLVGVLEVAADGKAGGEPGHRHLGRALVQRARDVQGGRLARGGG